MKLSIFQNYHLENQKELLDSEFIPNNNIGKWNKYYENKVLFDIYFNRKEEWVNSDYVGLVSPRFFEKTTLKGSYIQERIQENLNKSISKSVYLLTPYDYMDRYLTISKYTYMETQIVCKLMDADKLFPFQIYGNPTKIKCFCNFWVAKPDIFKDYIENYLEPCVNWFEINSSKYKEVLTKQVPHRQKITGLSYTVHPFLIEGLFACYLEYNKIDFDYILPKDFKMPMNKEEKALRDKEIKKNTYIKWKKKKEERKQLNELIHSPNLDSFDKFWIECKVVYGIQQKKQEFKDLIQIIQNNNLKTGIEIGAYSGGTTRGFLEYLDKLYTIDPNPRGPLNTLESKYPEKFNLIPLDSHKKSTKDILKGKLKEEKVDFLFIDGDHTYEGVKKDFLMYKDLVKKGGIIAFHDITDSERHHKEGCFVDKLWKEIRDSYPSKEIIHENTEWGNIGILFV